MIAKRHAAALVVLAIVAAPACGQREPAVDPGTPPPHGVPLPEETAETVPLTGSWSGRWRANDGSEGAFVLDWSQDGQRLTGRLTMDDRTCLPSAEVTGVVEGTQVRFEADGGTEQGIFSGILAGAMLSGSYSTTCSDENGTWETAKA